MDVEYIATYSDDEGNASLIVSTGGVFAVSFYCFDEDDGSIVGQLPIVYRVPERDQADAFASGFVA